MAGRALLDIQIERDVDRGDYVATVLTTAKGLAGEHRFHLPDLAPFMAQPQATAGQGRELVGGSAPWHGVDVREVGSALGAAFIGDGVERALRRMEGEPGLCIRLRLADD